MKTTLRFPGILCGLMLFAGCLNPHRPAPAPVATREATQWNQELAPGLRAEKALGLLLSRGFDVRVTRDENKQILRIQAVRPKSAPAAALPERIDVVIEDDVIRTAHVQRSR